MLSFPLENLFRVGLAPTHTFQGQRVDAALP